MKTQSPAGYKALNDALRQTKGAPSWVIELEDKDKNGKIEAKDFDTDGNGKIEGDELAELKAFSSYVDCAENSGIFKKGTATNLRHTTQAYVSQSTKKLKQNGPIDKVLTGLDLGTKLTLESKEKITQMIETVLKSVTGNDSKSTKEILGMLGKAKNVAGITQGMLTIVNEMKKENPNKRLIASKLIGMMADGLSLLPTKTQNRIVNNVSKFMSKAKSLRPLARLMTSLHAAGAGPEALKFVAALVEGKGSEMTKSLKDLGGKLKSSQPKKLFRLAAAVAMMLPKKARIKFIARAAARKISVVGTVVAGFADVAEIARGIYDLAKKGIFRTLVRGLTGLASTFCGLLPGLGTAASVSIDIGLLAEDVSHIVSQLSKQLKF